MRTCTFRCCLDCLRALAESAGEAKRVSLGEPRAFDFADVKSVREQIKVFDGPRCGKRCRYDPSLTCDKSPHSDKESCSGMIGEKRWGFGPDPAPWPALEVRS